MSAGFTGEECRQLEAAWNGPDEPNRSERRYAAAVRILRRHAMPLLLQAIAIGMMAVTVVQVVNGGIA